EISHDGKGAYVHRGPAYVELGAKAENDENEGQSSRNYQSYTSDVRRFMFTDASGRGVAFGQSFYSPKSLEALVHFETPMQAFLKDLPVAIGSTEGKAGMGFRSLNTGKLLARA